MYGTASLREARDKARQFSSQRLLPASDASKPAPGVHGPSGSFGRSSSISGLRPGGFVRETGCETCGRWNFWIQTAYEHHEPNNKDQTMPILLWLIGVPLSLVLLLMLAGVVHF